MSAVLDFGACRTVTIEGHAAGSGNFGCALKLELARLSALAKKPGFEVFAFMYLGLRASFGIRLRASPCAGNCVVLRRRRFKQAMCIAGQSTTCKEGPPSYKLSYKNPKLGSKDPKLGYKSLTTVSIVRGPLLVEVCHAKLRISLKKRPRRLGYIVSV